MDVVAEGRWAWMLYADGPRRVLSVLCGTVAMYSVAIELRPEDDAGDDGAVDRLARRVCDDPRAYWDRNLPGFDTGRDVQEATRRWRLRSG